MKTKNVKNSKEITENNATTDTTVQASMDGQRAEAGAPAETEEIQNTETVQAPTDHTPEALPTVLMDIATPDKSVQSAHDLRGGRHQRIGGNTPRKRFAAPSARAS